MTFSETQEMVDYLFRLGARTIKVGEVEASFPLPPPAPVPADERPLPRPERTLEEKLFDPLGIGKKDGKG
jgi:hypothetical protein